MSKQGGKFGRRQVLQLQADVKNQSKYGFGYSAAETSGALSGLVSHYGESDDDDSDEGNATSFKGQPAATTSGKGQTKGPTVPMQAFVAASDPDPINLIPVPTDSRLNGDSKQPKSILKRKEAAPKSILKPPKKEETKTTKDKSEVADSVEEKGKEIKDEVDEKLKDFLAEIDAMDHAPVDTDKTDLVDDDIDGEPMTPPTLEEFERQEVSESEDEEEDDPEPIKPKQPTTKWEHCLDEQTQYYYYWNIETNKVTWEIPEEFSQYLLQVKEYEVLQNKYEAAKRDWDERQKNKPTKVRTKKKAALVESKPPPPPPPPAISEEQKKEENVFPEKPEISAQIGPQPPPPPPENKQKTDPQTNENERKKSSAKEKKEKKEHKKHKKSKEHLDSVSNSSVVIGPQPAPPPLIGPQMPKEDPDIDGEPLQEESTVKPESNKPSNDTVGGMDVDTSEDMDDDFIHQQLEEPVFTHYEYVNKKLEAPPPPEPQPISEENTVKEESLNMDMEDIDKELEMALEKTKAVEASTSVVPKPAQGQKRNATEMESQPTVVHRPKRPKVDSPSTAETFAMASHSRLHKNDLRVKINSLAEASDLSNLVMDKLEFLEVHRGALSDLQILLIELETRVEDWKRGGLNLDYLLIKLREADNHLQKYEENAAPAGWTCQWDRQCRKYYYFHSATGASQWEYPLDYTETVEQVPPVDSSNPPTEQPQVKEEVEAPPPPPPPPPKVEVTDEKAANITPVKNTFLDFAQLAEAPPPPPGEPPPPGTAPLPSSEGDLSPRSHSHDDGYSDDDESETQDSSSDRDSESDSSIESMEKRRKDDDNRATNQEDDQRSQEGQEEPSLDQIPLLPVHSKPVHIAAQPVIKRPTPSVSPIEDSGEGDASRQKTEQVVSSEQAISELPGDSDTKHCGLELEGKSSECAAETAPSDLNTEAGLPVKSAGKEKKKKKDKSLSGGGLSMKRKGMSSMVEKWQRVQKDVEKGSKKKKTLPQATEDDN